MAVRSASPQNSSVALETKPDLFDELRFLLIAAAYEDSSEGEG